MEFPKGVAWDGGGLKLKKSFCRRGMDIFWTNILNVTTCSAMLKPTEREQHSLNSKVKYLNLSLSD